MRDDEFTQTTLDYELINNDATNPSMMNNTTANSSSNWRTWWNRIRSSRNATAFVVALALFTDMVVYGVVVPILPKVVEDMGRDSSDLGFLVASYAIGLLAFTPMFGMMSDRYGTRKAPMLAGLLGLAIATILFAFSREYWEIVLARMAQGISGGVSWSIGLSMIADSYPKAQLGTAMGVVMSANTLGTLLGPPIGGIMYKYISYEAPFLFCAGLAFVDFLCRLVVEPKPTKKIPPTAAPSSHTIASSPSPKTSMWAMIRDGPMLLMCIVTALVSTIYTAIEPTLPLHLKRIFNADTDTVGLLFTSIVVPNIFMSIAVGWISDRYGRKLTAAIGVILVAIAAPLITLPRSYGAQVPALMLFGGTAAFAMTPILPDMAEYADSHCSGAYGTVYALFNMSYSVGMLAGPMVAGLMYESMGFFWQMCALSLALLLVVPFIILADRRERRYRLLRIHAMENVTLQ
jgi:multidrug resistance protein